LYNSNFSLSASPLDPEHPGQNLEEQGTQKLSQLLLGTPNARVNPVYACDPTQGLLDHEYINSNCLTMPMSSGTVGQTAVLNGPAMAGYYLRGPAFFNSDVSFYKKFPVAEKQAIQFRFSVFNFLNHPLPSFDPSNTTTLDLHFKETGAGKWVQTNGDFGMAPIKMGRRVVQFALKYEF